jgi:glutamyl-tRNA reductase
LAWNLASLTAVYTSHNESPLNVIGALSQRVEEAYRTANARGVVVIATCNRFEVFMDTPQSIQPLLDLILSEGGNPKVVSGRSAARRLFRIASGLESRILGEQEVTGQVRRALEHAKRRGSTTGMLETVFRSALMAAKRVRRETGISWGPASYPHAAVKLATQELGRPPRRVLVVGAGETSERIVELLCGTAEAVYILSRSRERAARIASKCEGAARIGSISEIPQMAFDAAFFAVSGYRPPRVLSQKALVVVDLSLPPVVEGSPSTYTIEDVEAVVRDVIAERARWIRRAEEIIDEELRKLEEKIIETKASKAISAIVGYTQRILEEAPLNGNRREIERIVASIMHPLLVSLRRAAREARTYDEFLQIIEESFGDKR